MGPKIYVIFVADNTELGTCEAGKADVSKKDDKYMIDGIQKIDRKHEQTC